MDHSLHRTQYIFLASTKKRWGGRQLLAEILLQHTPVDVHDKLLDPLEIRKLRQPCVLSGIREPLLVVRDHAEELLLIRAVLVHILAAADLQQHLAVVLTIGHNLLFLKDVEAHQIQTDTRVKMFVTMTHIFSEVNSYALQSKSRVYTDSWDFKD